MKNWKGRRGGRNGMVVFLVTAQWKLFATFFFLRRFVFTTNHVPDLLFSPSSRSIRPSRYLSAVLASCSLTSDSKYNILVRPRRHLSHSSCARHPYADGRSRIPTLRQGNELIKRQSRATRAVCFSDFLVGFSPPFSPLRRRRASPPLPCISPLRRGLDPWRFFSPFLTARAVAIRTGWGLNRIVNVGEVRAPARQESFAQLYRTRLCTREYFAGIPLPTAIRGLTALNLQITTCDSLADSFSELPYEYH